MLYLSLFLLVFLFVFLFVLFVFFDLFFHNIVSLCITSFFSLSPSLAFSVAYIDTLSMRFVSSVLAASAWFLAASHALLPDYSVVDIIAMTDPALHTIADKLPEVIIIIN